MYSKVKEIYNYLIQDAKYMKTASQAVDKEIDRIARKEKADIRKIENFRNKLTETASIGEEAGFIKGFKYSLLLLTECFAENGCLL